MATNSLSPNRAAQRMLKYRAAVMTIARYRAKRAVQANIRAKGLKINQFTAREIAELADALERNREELIARATQDAATFPEFARYGVGANINKNAQTQSPPKSTTSAVQMSGAK